MIEYFSRYLRFFIYLVLILPVVTSCSGYRFRNIDNPLLDFHINSVSIPMFLNRSILPNVSGPMTKEIIKELSSFPKLTIYPGNSPKAEAVLLGIIDSKKSKKEFYSTTGTTLIKDGIGAREAFFLPNNVSYQLEVTLILIRNPSSTDLEVIRSNFVKYLGVHPKVVFAQTLHVTGSASRVLAHGDVNFTQDKGIMEKSIGVLASSTAKSFKELILNAF